MASRRKRLELTWIGKDERPRLEPRILLEDPELSYHADKRVSENDIFDNMLIHGDNLLALKALEQEYAGQVKCIYIDPPFNTGQAFEHYDDGIEHSLWLSLMRDRFQLLHTLLGDSGTIFVHIDDNELGYLVVLMDEIFGRSNRVSIATFKQGAPTGHKAINPGCVTTTNFVVMYAKSKPAWSPNRVFTPRDRDKRHNQFIRNVGAGIDAWKIVPLSEAFAEHLGVSVKDARKHSRENPDALDDFVASNPEAVVRLARPNYNAVSKDARDAIDESKANPDVVVHLPREDYKDFYFIRGERILFYKHKLKEINGEYVAGEPLTTLWDDLLSNNLHKEGGVSFPKGKKPEALVKRVIELATNPGDLVLDSFAGSGTTGAVAHKMGRRWIMVELGEHCLSHVRPRLKRVVDGTDSSGVTQATNWVGGGGFRFYRLAPSLLERDKWGNWVVSKEYDGPKLAEAMCKLHGFRYDPDPEVFWLHGRSTETDFLYVTDQTLTADQLLFISDEVGPERSLLVCCRAWRAKAKDYDNLTLEKIPQSVLSKCEWGRDDYSLNVQDLTPDVASSQHDDEGKPKRKKRKPAVQELPLFAGLSKGGDQ